jgi:putative tryptophan/tyrosine transport system substrate-binding protein
LAVLFFCLAGFPAQEGQMSICLRRREFIAGLGSAAAWPVVARAQQAARLPIIGFLHDTQYDKPAVDAFEQGLADAGFIVHENVAIEYRWANLQYGRLPFLVSDLIARRVAVIVAGRGGDSVRAAKAATETIPIVFLYGGNPVKDGFVASLRAPDGNLTGLTGLYSELGVKRLSLLHEMVPHAATIGFLTVAAGNNALQRDHQNNIIEAARSLGLELVKSEDVFDLPRAFATFVERQVGAVFIDNLGRLDAARPTIVRLAQQHKIPAIYPGSSSGGLMSYGTAEGITRYRQAAREYVARILKGAKPADLPVHQPTKFELVINLKTAKALGLSVPETLLATADKVIE